MEKNHLNRDIKIKIITFLFSISIFFWGIEIFEFELRFSYLLSLIFLSGFIVNLRLTLFLIFLIIHSIFFNYYLGISFSSLFFLQLTILILTCILVYNFYDLIILKIDQLVFYFFFIFIILLVLDFILNTSQNSFTSISCFFGCFSTKKFIFKENSHFAISVIPVLIYLCLKKQNYKNFIFIFVLLLISYFNFSTTLFLGLISLSIIFLLFEWKKSTLNQKKNISILLIFSILISIVNIDNNALNTHKSPILHRFHALFDTKIYAIDPTKNIFKEKNNKNLKEVEIKNNQNKDDINYNIDPSLPDNLSTDVVLKSLKISLLSIMNYPFGVGFNNYEYAHKEFIDNIKTKYPLTKIFNIQDGSNNFIKLLTEFGIFSILFGYLMIRFFFQKTNNLELKYFLLSFIVVEVFIRGAGYFNGGFYLIFLLIYLSVYKKKLK